MKRIFLIIPMLLTPVCAWAETGQAPKLEGFQHWSMKVPAPRHATDPGTWQKIYERGRRNSLKLKANQGFKTQALDHSVEMIWPVRASEGFTGNHVESLSNYLDQDTSQGGLLDWNCTSRTYDGHNGTDIQMGFFNWYGMRNDHGIVVAAADGTIIDKVGDQPEESCTFGTEDGDNNLVLLEHGDGSMSIYAHMRTDSLTKKAIGDTVEAGDYLGVIGSAGISTGPHLHFGVGFFETEGNITRFVEQDPWAGSCNSINSEGWWAGEQPPDLRSALMDIYTHSAFPEQRPCPESEVPNFADEFTAGGNIFFCQLLRDPAQGMMVQVLVEGPDGSELINSSSPIDNDSPGALITCSGGGLPGNAQAGMWTYTVTFANETITKNFWVDAEPEGRDPLPDSNNAYNGLWYDPALEGEGYNIVTTTVGTVIYFYGSDDRGNRLWLISELIREPFEDGRSRLINMSESTGGTFDEPIMSSRGLSHWGTLRLEFSDCTGGEARLNGVDGFKVSAIQKLTSVPGADCFNADANAAAGYSGLWYDPELEGEGFNVVVAPVGTVFYYYGFDADGNRMWLLGGPVDFSWGANEKVTVELLRATQGTFKNPVNSNDALESWGTMDVTALGCNEFDVDMTTTEGEKVVDGQKLIGVGGIDC